MSNNSINKLNQYTFSDDVDVTFSYSDGTDTFHFNETHVDTALQETDVVDRVVNVLVSDLPVSTTWGNEPVLNVLRDADLLENYERDFTFNDYLTETINENFYDLSDIIEESTEQYDHKRGFTTLTSTVKANLSDVVGNADDFAFTFSGWTMTTTDVNGATLSWEVSTTGSD